MSDEREIGGDPVSMTVLEDRDGRRYLLLKRSMSSSLVLDIDSGERLYRPNDRLSEIDTAAFDRDSRDVGSVFPEVPVAREREILSILEDHGAVPVRRLLEMTTACESELFASLRELEAAGLIAATTIADERASVLTEEAVARFEEMN